MSKTKVHRTAVAVTGLQRNLLNEIFTINGVNKNDRSEFYLYMSDHVNNFILESIHLLQDEYLDMDIRLKTNQIEKILDEETSKIHSVYGK